MAAASQTFQRDAALPFDESPANPHGPAEGRRRLSGAFLIDIDRIETDPDQPRKRVDQAYLEELTQSVRRHGVLQPISVRYIEKTNTYRIVAGECRYAAAVRAGLQELPCWVKSPRENEILVQQVVENWVRSDLSAFELADSLAILRDANGWTQQELARQTGKSKGEVSKLLSILALDPEVQSKARSDPTQHVTKRHLYALSRLPASDQRKLFDRVWRDNLSASDVERRAERILYPQQPPPRPSSTASRRAFRTNGCRVVFTFDAPDNSNRAVAQAIEEVKRQIHEQGAT